MTTNHNANSVIQIFGHFLLSKYFHTHKVTWTRLTREQHNGIYSTITYYVSILNASAATQTIRRVDFLAHHGSYELL